ncbi:MAG: hypothetical protein ACKO3W_05475 [bacterium]
MAASAERLASERTSSATTANPLPASPARAASTAATVARVPFYIVHGTDDPVVPVTLSRTMRESIAGELRASDSKSGDECSEGTSRESRLRYREYEGAGHDSSTPAYRFGDDGVLDWMFAQRKG